MSKQTDTFTSELRTKINDADERLKDLEIKAKTAGQKARDEAKAQLARLDDRAKEQRQRFETAQAKVKSWTQEKKAATSDKIAEWKAQRQVKKLTDRADNAESNAVASMQVALAAFDEAEKAAVEAMIARMDADAVQTPATRAAG